MKHSFLIIALCAILASMTQSCRVRSINGELDARWQITHILYADGTETTPDSLYISFYRHTIQFYTPPPIWENKPTGNMAYDEATATIAVEMPWWTPTLHDWGMDIPADLAARPYLTSLKVQSLTDKYLSLLTPQGTAITLRKF